MKATNYLLTIVIAVAASVALSFAVMKCMNHVAQDQVCVAGSDAEALNCPEGQLFMARMQISEQDLQNTLGLENRLLNTIALYCDSNYPVEKTRTGVLCVLTHERINKAAANATAQQQQQQQQN